MIMKTYEEKIQAVRKQQELLKEQEKQLLIQFKEDEKKKTTRRHLEIGRFIEDTIGKEITNMGALKRFISLNTDSIKRTQEDRDF